MKDPVKGTAGRLVLERPLDARQLPHDAGRAAPGVEPFSGKHHALVVPTDRWPWPGMSIPVTVDRANPEKIDIDWDEVPRVGDTAMNEADALVEALKQSGSRCRRRGPCRRRRARSSSCNSSSRARPSTSAGDRGSPRDDRSSRAGAGHRPRRRRRRRIEGVASRRGGGQRSRGTLAQLERLQLCTRAAR